MDSQEAFRVLQTNLEIELREIQQAGAVYFTQGDTTRVREAADRVENIKKLLDMLRDLQSQWQQVMPGPQRQKPPQVVKSSQKMTPRGEKTSQEDFYLPILKTLVEMGGSGRTGQVIDRVGELMEGVLNDLDREILDGRREIRWRNSAAWARKDLVEFGYLSNRSPNGIWEITAEGRRFLTNQKR